MVLSNDRCTSLRASPCLATQDNIGTKRNPVELEQNMDAGVGLLANEEDVDSTEVEVVEERERSKAVVGGVLASVELFGGLGAGRTIRTGRCQ